MSSFAKKLVIDTNVPKTSNLAHGSVQISQELKECVFACVEAIEHVTEKGGLVMDSKGDIFNEYLNNLSLRGQPGIGDRFIKWVHDNQWKFPAADHVAITKKGNSYVEFPNHDDLMDFDSADRKFVAVANAHPEKPSILQATDCKWWGWKDALSMVGVKVHFLCPGYVQEKYREKSGV